jgi:hypothetical protein
MSSPSDQRLEVLRDLVEEKETELHVAVGELEVAARRAVDARHWIRSRPFVCVGGAFLVGAWLGGRRT